MILANIVYDYYMYLNIACTYCYVVSFLTALNRMLSQNQPYGKDLLDNFLYTKSISAYNYYKLPIVGENACLLIWTFFFYCTNTFWDWKKFSNLTKPFFFQIVNQLKYNLRIAHIEPMFSSISVGVYCQTGGNIIMHKKSFLSPTPPPHPPWKFRVESK